MKIIIIGPVYPYRGGIAHYNTMLIQRLQLQKCDVKAISFRRQYPNWLYPGQTDKDKSQSYVSVPAEFLLDPLYPWTWRHVAKEIIKEKPDLVLIQWWTTFWAVPYSFLASWIEKKQIRIIFQIHNVMPHESRPWDRWLSKTALSFGDAFIVHTEKEAKRLRLILPDARYRIVPLPVNMIFDQTDLTPIEAKKRLNLPADFPVILAFGIVRPYKGLRYLLEAVEILKREGMIVHLVVAGEFWEPLSAYQAIIDKLHIQDQVHIYNQYIANEDVPVYFKASDVFAAPYVGGTQSAAVKTALVYGLPVVLTNIILDDILAHHPLVSTVKRERLGKFILIDKEGDRK